MIFLSLEEISMIFVQHPFTQKRTIGTRRIGFPPHPVFATCSNTLTNNSCLKENRVTTTKIWLKTEKKKSEKARLSMEEKESIIYSMVNTYAGERTPHLVPP